jgi:hypothetical protein
VLSANSGLHCVLFWEPVSLIMVGECVAIVVGLCWKPWMLWRYFSSETKWWVSIYTTKHCNQHFLIDYQHICLHFKHDFLEFILAMACVSNFTYSGLPFFPIFALWPEFFLNHLRGVAVLSRQHIDLPIPWNLTTWNERCFSTNLRAHICFPWF